MNHRRIGWMAAASGISFAVSGLLLGQYLSHDLANLGIVASIIRFLVWSGAAVGVLFGLAWSYSDIKNAKGPRERSFAAKKSIFCWILVVAFFACTWVFRSKYHGVVLLFLAVGLAILWLRRKQTKIRREESGQQD